MKLKSSWPLLFLFFANLVFSRDGLPETAQSKSNDLSEESGVLAMIGEYPITTGVFRAEMARRRIDFDSKRKKEELLDSMVRGELFFSAARADGYEKDPEVIAAIKQAMVGKYRRDKLQPFLDQLDASDKEVEAFYQSHREEFGSPALVHIALIRISVSPRASEERRAKLLKRAESARAEALTLDQAVPGFGNVAIKYSEDQGSRYRGGDIGWQKEKTMDSRWHKNVSTAIVALTAPGQVSPVIAAPDGYYIVKLMEVQEVTIKPFAEVKNGVRYLVIQEKKERVEREFTEQLKKKISVTVNRDLLQLIGLHDEANNPGPPPLAR